MKVYAFVLLIAFCYVECRKIVPPIDKNANIAFINMEGGGVRSISNNKPTVPNSAPVQPAPAKTPSPTPAQPAATTPKQVATTPKPVAPQPVPPKQAPTAAPAPKPSSSNLITPKPVNPPASSHPITTPGPGSVKQLITFYDSQGKASPIRPYTYSQAVKQG